MQSSAHAPQYKKFILAFSPAGKDLPRSTGPLYDYNHYAYSP